MSRHLLHGITWDDGSEQPLPGTQQRSLHLDEMTVFTAAMVGADAYPENCYIPLLLFLADCRRFYC